VFHSIQHCFRPYVNRPADDHDMEALLSWSDLGWFRFFDRFWKGLDANRYREGLQVEKTGCPRQKVAGNLKMAVLKLLR
jgi:hypothetical protein